jgi:hypothetical protein
MSLESTQTNVMSIDVLTSQDNGDDTKIEQQQNTFPDMEEKEYEVSRLKKCSNIYDDTWDQEGVMFKRITDDNPKVMMSPYTTNGSCTYALSPSSTSFLSNHSSDHDNDSGVLLSPVSRPDIPPLYYSPVDRRAKKEKEKELVDGSMDGDFKSLKAFEFEYPHCYTYFHHQQQQQQQKQGSKKEALQTRRARNKLASAKYRAKKQALTHAMQDRIMQLATQVKNLRSELCTTKKSEAEIVGRYNHLLSLYHNQIAIKKQNH